jgi:hypothetical protein
MWIGVTQRSHLPQFAEQWHEGRQQSHDDGKSCLSPSVGDAKLAIFFAKRNCRNLGVSILKLMNARDPDGSFFLAVLRGKSRSAAAAP